MSEPKTTSTGPAGGGPGRLPPARGARTTAGSALAAVAAILTVLLVTLLVVYLYALSRTAPPAPPESAPPAAPAPAAPSPDQEKRWQALREECARLLREGQEAAANRRQEDALEKYAEIEAILKKLPPGPALDAERSRVRDRTAEAQRELEERRRRERDEQFRRRWEEVRRLAAELGADAWERALALADGLLADFPDKADEVKPLRDSLVKKIDGVNSFVQEKIQKAAADAQAGRYGAAFEHLRLARLWKAKDPGLDAASGAIRAALAARDLVRVSAGPFPMGSDDPQDGNPRRAAESGEFLIDRFEVTNEQYAWFCADAGHSPPPSWRKGAYPPDRAGHPVTEVTAEDAEAYAQWLGKRLPTEEEWEKAARGTDGRVYPWGNAMPEVPPCNCVESKRPAPSPDGAAPGGADAAKPAPDTVPVGTCPGGESPCGAADMAGNVWEWTATQAKVEEDGKAEGRVLRGGSFLCRREGLRCARRYVERADLRLKDVGFRCVKDP